MTERTALLEKDGAPTLEELKEHFRNHDFSAQVSSYDFEHASNDRNKIYIRIKKFFLKAWEEQLKILANRGSMLNFTEFSPIGCLESAEEKLVAGTVMELMENDELSAVIMESVLTEMEEPMLKEFEVYAIELHKPIDELTDEEIKCATDKFADIFLAKMMNLFMRTQSVTEIMNLSKEIGAEEDFNKEISKNFDRTTFDRKWNQFKLHVEELLSLDQMRENGIEIPDATCAFKETESMTDEELEDIYLQMLDSTQREIYSYRKNNMTQKEIARALGYKTPSAVSKQMKKMLEKFYEMKSKME